ASARRQPGCSYLVLETGVAPGRRRGGRVSSRLHFSTAWFSHCRFSFLSVSTRRLAHAAPGVLFRLGRWPGGLCAAPGILLAHFWLAGDRALDGAGILARTVRCAGALVSIEVR